MFADIQRKGPFAYWYHRHLFCPLSDSTTLMTDEIEYKLPAGFLGDVFGNWIVQGRLQKMFDYRHRAVAEKIAKEMQTIT